MKTVKWVEKLVALVPLVLLLAFEKTQAATYTNFYAELELNTVTNINFLVCDPDASGPASPVWGYNNGSWSAPYVKQYDIIDNLRNGAQIILKVYYNGVQPQVVNPDTIGWITLYWVDSSNGHLVWGGQTQISASPCGSRNEWISIEFPNYWPYAPIIHWGCEL